MPFALSHRVDRQYRKTAYRQSAHRRLISRGGFSLGGVTAYEEVKKLQGEKDKVLVIKQGEKI